MAKQILTNKTDRQSKPPPKYTITQKEFDTLEHTQGQLIGLSDITNEVDKFGAVALLLKPIIDSFEAITPEEIGGAA